MPRASSGTLADSVNIATAWFSFCRAEALRDTVGKRLAAVQTQRDHAFPADFPETLHDALYMPGDGEVNEAWSQRLSVAAWELLFTRPALAGDMVIEANFHPHSELEVDRLRGLGDRVVEVHCACPAEVAVAMRMHARLGGIRQARARPGTGTGTPSSGYPHCSLAPIPVRHASVDTATQRPTALQGDICRDREETPR
jgi:hypothetical protein